MEVSNWIAKLSEQLVLLDLGRPDDREKFLKFLNQIKEECEDLEVQERINEFLKRVNSGEDWTTPSVLNLLFQQEQKAPQVDPEFGPEFCEKYLSDLEELAEWVSTKAMEETPDIAEIYKRVKRFVHTMKGDSGSVGFSQLERSCHVFEDALQKLPQDSIVDLFLDFSSYCTKVLTNWRKNIWVEQTWSMSSFEKDESKASQAANNDAADIDLSVFGEKANLDLLKELLHDPEYADLIKKEAMKEISVNQGTDPSTKDLAKSNDTQPEPSNSQERSPYSLEGDPELYSEFVLEAEDHLTNVEQALMADPEKEVDLIFRCVHSIKGASGFFKFKEVQEISHILENLLDEVRSKQRSFCEGLKLSLAKYIDLIRRLLEEGKVFWKSGNKIAWTQDGLQLLSDLEQVRFGISVISNSQPSDQNVDRSDSNSIQPVKKEVKDQEKPFVKVDTVRLDHLIDSIGEMCIYTNMLVRQARMHLKDNIEVLDVTHQVEKFARELQSVGIALRLVPVKGLFQKMARLVWDLSKKTGKPIKFEMVGEETELDRNIIEKLTDPLLHMVRNCVDHGIEPPDERAKLGKPTEGKITLEACHKGGTIQIILSDDGRGLDPEKILQKAVQKGLVSKDQKLTREEIFSLIFMPGFSTAEQVTELSGRGVGMDVVRRNVSDLRGRIIIESEKGHGTSFTIELPLTLAILDGIMVRVSTEVYLVPTLTVVEIVDAGNDIFLTNEKGLTFNFRGQYLSLYDAAVLFQCPNYEGSLESYKNKKVLVLETGTDRFALLVDEVLESFTTVIKSIDSYVGARKGISGCSVMSDGSVALIIDVRELLELAKKNGKKSLSHQFMPC